MTDIVERLRADGMWFRGENDVVGPHVKLLVEEAADEIERLRSRVETLERMDSEAATYVESVICLKSNFFTGEPPYVGWKGLGLALTQDYARIEFLQKCVATWQGIHEGAVAAMQAENQRLALDYLGQIGQLSDEIERLRAALKWFADAANYNHGVTEDMLPRLPDVLLDGREVARAALDALIEEDGKLIFETPTEAAQPRIHTASAAENTDDR